MCLCPFVPFRRKRASILKIFSIFLKKFRCAKWRIGPKILLQNDTFFAQNATIFARFDTFFAYFTTFFARFDTFRRPFFTPKRDWRPQKPRFPLNHSWIFSPWKFFQNFFLRKMKDFFPNFQSFIKNENSRARRPCHGIGKGFDRGRGGW